MSIEHIVVDGSNIATEGRSHPSLKQLEEAVAELRRDHPDAEITVIVDATFAHRIDPSEVPRFEEAELRGEYVHPPAGAIGRGDAFLLRVAEKVDGTVLSNDSFQEFHGEHPWLFERGRLLGGTPVPGIGWIFSPRQPVRGPRSRQAVRETTQAKKRVTKAIAVATKEVVEPAGRSGEKGTAGGSSARRSRASAGAPAKVSGESRDGDKPTPLAVNDPLAFISFIAEHRLGEQLEGEVESYTSHGAVVRVGDMRCYVPLANLADPPPRSAREVLKRKERRVFVLTALDPQRRGAELALPGIAAVSGHPREETVAAEVRLAKPPRKRPEAQVQPRVALGAPPVPTASTPPPGRRPARPKTGPSVQAEVPASARDGDGPQAQPAKASRAKPVKPTARKVPAKSAAKKAPAKKESMKAAPVDKAAAGPAKKAPEKKQAMKAAPAKKAPAKKTANVAAKPAAKARSAGNAPKTQPAKRASGRSASAKKVQKEQRAKKALFWPASGESSSSSDTKSTGPRRSPRATAKSSGTGSSRSSRPSAG